MAAQLQEEEEAAGSSVTMVVHVTSSGFDSGNIAKILINDNLIEVEKNESGHHRGLHIVVISPVDGKVIASKAFDTYKSSNGLNHFLN